MAIVFIDALVDHCPSWAWLLLLIVAFLAAVTVSGYGLKLLGGLMARMRRRALS